MLPKLVYIVTVSMTADHLLRGQLRHMQQAGFEVVVVTSPDPRLAEVAAREGVEIIGLPMEREINLHSDLIALWQLFWLLRRLKPAIVNASTPKAGLLGMTAAWLAGVPIRIYLLRGLRLETTTGWRRWLLSFTERLAITCAQSVVCVSASLRQLCNEEELAPERKLIVLGHGSSNGVDTRRFLPSPEMCQVQEKLRITLSLPPQVPVIGFVGRFTRDKGIIELVEAFETLLPHYPDLRLLLVGKFEEGDPVPAEVVAKIQSHPQIVQAGFVTDTAPYYGLMNVLAFPSYREGLPNAPLEAAIANVPTVGFVATGVIDVIVDQQTGLIAEPRSSQSLAAALATLLANPDRCRQMGEQARAWVSAHFESTTVWDHWAKFYQDRLLSSNVYLPLHSLPVKSTVRNN